MRERKAARLLVINPSKEILLFRFHHTDNALAGTSHWATPGGGLEQGETFHAAAVRELYEETGIKVKTVGEPVADRRVSLLLPTGEAVAAVEQYFIVHVPSITPSRTQWTAHDKEGHGQPSLVVGRGVEKYERNGMAREFAATAYGCQRIQISRLTSQ